MSLLSPLHDAHYIAILQAFNKARGYFFGKSGRREPGEVAHITGNVAVYDANPRTDMLF
jgi:hypothetical protein